ncbi:PaaI family thioesterase [Streptomyces sp. NPDC056987]|uniref:PaaI family thioesterase n=1 Tax=Streptomyces sp. NPDC056987 TaxID=3345988 RepID=UPI0036272E2E
MAERIRPEEADGDMEKRVLASFGRQGLMAHLGARISRVEPGRVHIVLPGRPEVTQHHGYFHAGATGAIADTAGGYAAYTLFPEKAEVLTVEYKINLLAPAVGDRIEAVGTVLRSGRTLTVCQLEVYGVRDGGERKDERKLVANGQQTLIRVDRPPER